VKNQDTSGNRVNKAYLALGSNLGDRLLNLEKAKFLLLNNNVKIYKSSKFYETPSWPNPSFPKFINIVIQIETNLKPQSLLNLIKTIERKLGRTSKKKNYPRTCDIDILDFNNKIFKRKNLIIPHTDLHKRNFVLIPFHELTKDWKHPVFRKKIAELIMKLNYLQLMSIKQI